MSERTYAGWVEPIALVLAEDRRDLIDFAAAADAEFWLQSSEVKGWTNTDILAHIAGGNDQLVQIVLRSVVRHEPLDPAAFQVDTDAENASRVAERRKWPVGALIAELARDGDEVDNLLSQLTDVDEGLRGPGFPMSLGDFLRVVGQERHDFLHLQQMRRR